MKQALVDVYGAECARLQGEVKRLSAADVATGSEDAQHPQQQSRDSAAVNSIQKLSQVSLMIFLRSVANNLSLSLSLCDE